MPAPRHNKYQGLFEYPDGQWGIDCILFGKRVRRKIGSEARARKEYQDLKAAERRGETTLQPLKQTRRTIGDWIDVYLSIPRGKSDVAFMEMWRDLVGNRYPEQLSQAELKAWAHGLLQEGKAVASVLRIMGPFRACYTKIAKSGEIAYHQNPFCDMDELELPKLNNKRDEYVHLESVSDLATAFGPTWWPYAVFAILAHMRFGNQRRLRWDNIDWTSQIAILEKTKKGVKHHTPLSTLAIDLLRAQHARQLAEGKLSEWCWPNSKGGQLDSAHFRQNVWAPAFRRAGLKPAAPEKGEGTRKRQGLSWHDLSRHTGATWLAQVGTDPLVLQSLMDHGDLRTTERYLTHCQTRKKEGAERLAELARKALRGDVPDSMGVSKTSVAVPKSQETDAIGRSQHGVTVRFSQN